MLGQNITIIGGSGGMGKVFARYFKKHGFNVTLYARDKKKLTEISCELEVNSSTNLEESIKNADIIMISIPIKKTTEMVNRVTPLMKKNALIFDITSLKFSVFKALEEASSHYPINCLSLHPMFGPGIKSMKNYVIIALKVGGTEDYQEIIDELFAIFESDGLIITYTTPEEHDKRMALTLAVPHMFNILFLNLLRKSGIALNELTRFTGTTFLLQKVFAESIIQREMEMFGEIQMENLQFHDILNLFEALVKDYKEIIQNKRESAFQEIFTDGLEYSREDDHFEKSYKYFYDFMKVLKRED